MFPVNTAFQRALDSTTDRNLSIEWWGTLTLTNGTVYDFTTDDIAQGTGSLTSNCDLPGVGGAYSTEFQVQFFLPVDPRSLKGATIALFVRMAYKTNTWGEASNFFWSDLISTEWGDSPRMISTDVPMGVFAVTEAKRAINSIKVIAYDNMLKFDTLLPHMDAVARTPFEWLHWICNACGVELGMTNAEVKALVNGNRKLIYADIDKSIKKCRDLLSHLAALLCGIAVINRYGKLVIVRYGAKAVSTFTPDNRFSSAFSDYQYYYTGIWAQYKAKGMQEFYKNVETLDDDGLIIDLGVNPFLQISNDSNRAAAIQAVIDAFRPNNVKFTPFDVSVPLNPTYDLLDVLSFSGGHTPADSYGPITSIHIKISGSMTLQCATPEEQENPTRETTRVDGLSGAGTTDGTFYASSEFFVVISSFPDAATVIDGDTLTTELTVDCTADNTCTQIAWTGAYTLDEDATVTVKILVDDKSIYEISDDQKAGNHTLNVTTGHNITTRGAHTVKVILREDVP